MSHERRMKLGLLAEKREALRRVESRAEGIRGSLMDATFVVDSVLDLDGQRVSDYGREFCEVLAEGQALRSRIEELEEELGI